jgi:hypothetical protein
VKLPIATFDGAVLGELHRRLRPQVVTGIVDGLVAALAPATTARDVRRSRTDLQTVDRALARLTEAVTLGGGELRPLLDEMKKQQARRTELAATIASHEAVDLTRVNRAAIARTVETHLGAWRTTLADRNTARVRQMFRDVLDGPLMVTPKDRTYQFEGELRVGSLISGEIGLPPFWRARQDSNLRPPA